MYAGTVKVWGYSGEVAGRDRGTYILVLAQFHTKPLSWSCLANRAGCLGENQQCAQFHCFHGDDPYPHICVDLHFQHRNIANLHLAVAGVGTVRQEMTWRRPFSPLHFLRDLHQDGLPSQEIRSAQWHAEGVGQVLVEQTEDRSSLLHR